MTELSAIAACNADARQRLTTLREAVRERAMTKAERYEAIREHLDGLQFTHLRHKHGWMVDVYNKQFYVLGTLIHKPSEFGLYITPMREIVSVWSRGGGKLPEMMRLASRAGGGRLTCFGEPLATMYARAGCTVLDCEPFEAQLAPDRWDMRKHGTPDLYTMALPPTR